MDLLLVSLDNNVSKYKYGATKYKKYNTTNPVLTNTLQTGRWTEQKKKTNNINKHKYKHKYTTSNGQIQMKEGTNTTL